MERKTVLTEFPMLDARHDQRRYRREKEDHAIAEGNAGRRELVHRAESSVKEHDGYDRYQSQESTNDRQEYESAPSGTDALRATEDSVGKLRRDGFSRNCRRNNLGSRHRLPFGDGLFYPSKASEIPPPVAFGPGSE